MPSGASLTINHQVLAVEGSFRLSLKIYVSRILKRLWKHQPAGELVNQYDPPFKTYCYHPPVYFSVKHVFIIHHAFRALSCIFHEVYPERQDEERQRRDLRLGAGGVDLPGNSCLIKGMKNAIFSIFQGIVAMIA